MLTLLHLHTISVATTQCLKYGVASGPTDTGAVFWTHAEPACCSALTLTIAGSTVPVESRSDWLYTVHHEVALAPGDYEYSFACTHESGTQTVAGKTRILSPDKQDVNLLVATCSMWEAGEFRAYSDMAVHLEAGTADAALHVGDFIYEYGPDFDDRPNAAEPQWQMYINRWGRYPAVAVDPPRDIVTVDDYTLRYKQYLTDHNLQRLRAAGMFLHIPDDHEVANNRWDDGAENHMNNVTFEGEVLDQGEYLRREHNALFVRNAMMPVSLELPSVLNRIYSLGGAADLITLDDYAARAAPQSASATVAKCHDPFLWDATNLPAACTGAGLDVPTCALGGFDTAFSRRFAEATVCFQHEDNNNPRDVRLGREQVMRTKAWIAGSTKPTIILGKGQVVNEIMSIPQILPAFAGAVPYMAYPGSILATMPSLTLGLFLTYGGSINNGARLETESILATCAAYSKKCIFVNGDWHSSHIAKLSHGGLELNVPAVTSFDGPSWIEDTYANSSIAQIPLMVAPTRYQFNLLTKHRYAADVDDAVSMQPKIFANLQGASTGAALDTSYMTHGMQDLASGKGYGLVAATKTEVTITNFGMPIGCQRTSDQDMVNQIDATVEPGYKEYYEAHCGTFAPLMTLTASTGAALTPARCAAVKAGYQDGNCCN